MKFPKELFVAIDVIDTQNILIAREDPSALYASHDTRTVARYQLVEMGEVVNQSIYRAVKKSSPR